ncbi:MAG: right-handed parallel beta-helix repeat-containing protein [Planctomycetota bacterium]|jgi:hypothetical protein
MLPLFLLLGSLLCPSQADDEVRVNSTTGLRRAIREAEPGTRIIVLPGSYGGGIALNGVKGEPGKRIVIQGLNADQMPLFAAGPEAFHLSDCEHVALGYLRIAGQPANGINIDDGGTYGTPSKDILIHGVRFENIGPRGNCDALKLSGVVDFKVRQCSFAGWGGSAIDMVGCHRGIIENCTFEGRGKCSQWNAVQIKGGSTEILVHRNFFKDCGHRAVNLGGSTGLQFFRPEATDFEAKDVEIAGNIFVRGTVPVAWVTANGGRVHHNTIYLPEKWVLRILQETESERFKPCRGGVFENNLVVFDKSVKKFVNIGPRTAPGSFAFRNNAWFDLDGGRTPELPTKEEGGVYGLDPKLEGVGGADMRITSEDEKFEDIGAGAYEREEEEEEEEVPEEKEKKEEPKPDDIEGEEKEEEKKEGEKK